MKKLFYSQIQPLDEKRKVFIGKNEKETVSFSAHYLMEIGKKAVQNKGSFSLALSGGSTPKKIFSYLQKHYADSPLWKKTYLFWSDERAVSPKDKDSNYKMAMEAGFETIPIPKKHIFRMKADKEIEKEAQKYEKLLQEKLGEALFDLVMLGMGDDGHTASLFPNTKGLLAKDALVIANYIPQKKTWRMSLTFEAINQSQNICLYVLGENKAEKVQEIFSLEEEKYPVQKVGSFSTPALWILDEKAAQLILSK